MVDKAVEEGSDKDEDKVDKGAGVDESEHDGGEEDAEVSANFPGDVVGDFLLEEAAEEAFFSAAGEKKVAHHPDRQGGGEFGVVFHEVEEKGRS
ncbi:MAG: hypothetical protein SP1CHLAM54_13330 [Chlamydiia bacterium]|nr:hypothetical protein [Chlamydiia bacterium]MCH9616229.1 hypothetical protein [Chlamydiia bacterium]MCH9629785.1 hypothetical protein [Chlamydiia bacterium]